MTTRRHGVSVAGLVIGAFVLGGCVGDDPDAASSAQGTTTPGEVSVPDATPSGLQDSDAALTVPPDELGLPPMPQVDSYPQRPAFPADPDDPEPIESTGADLTQVISPDDPSAFTCLLPATRATVEMLDVDGEAYEPVAEVWRFDAVFADGTQIEIRVDPAVGSADDVRREVDRHVGPLGRLPTMLRRDIGMLTIRPGDRSAAASQGEGITVQTGNVDIRTADDQYDETLFHEAVHTSLDPRFAFQRSDVWLEAQRADGRFLTTYGRENPDTEDLAESFLYAFGALHHPDRVSVDVVIGRIPNRVTFVEELLPPDEPIMVSIGPTSSCD